MSSSNDETILQRARDRITRGDQYIIATLRAGLEPTNSLLEEILARLGGQQPSQQTGIPSLTPPIFPGLILPTPTSNHTQYSISITQAGKLQQLFKTSVPSRFSILFAPATNAGTIYVGNSSEGESNGFPLDAGKELDTYLDDLSKIWIIGTNAGDVLKIRIEWGAGKIL